jgi:hypothetical protein
MMSGVTIASDSRIGELETPTGVVDGQTGQLPPLAARERRRAARPFPKPAPGSHLAIEEGGEILLVALDRPVLHIGRSPAADIVLDDATVSRRHAVIAR